MIKNTTLYFMAILFSTQTFAIPRSALEERVKAFTKSFDNNDLNTVMTFFSEHATYRTVQGDRFVGIEQIRAAFEPQFNGAYGKMNFEITQINIDESQKKLTMTWICHHDFTQSAQGFVNNLTRLFYRLISSKKAFWYGLDVFEFDEKGFILDKSSYTTSNFPRMFKDN